MTDLRLIVTFGKTPILTEVVLRSVTAPRRRTILTHWRDVREGEAFRAHGTATLDFPWVGESLVVHTHDNFIGTEVFLFETDPRVLVEGARIPCWNAGTVLGHSLGTASVCLGHVGNGNATFWNTSFNRVHIRSATTGGCLDLVAMRSGYAALPPSWHRT